MKLIQGLLPVLLMAGVVQAQDTKKANQISGVVTFNGKPLSAGLVIFHDKAMRNIVKAEIGEDGKYRASRVKPAEAVKVTIDVEIIEVLGKQLKERLAELENRAKLIKMAKKENAELDKEIAEMKDRLKTIDKVRKDVVKVPKKYTDIETTPLSFEVKEGEQTINIELKD